MTYIGYPQTEELLQKRTKLRTFLSGSVIELRTKYVQGSEFMGSKEEILYALAVCNHVLSDMPFGGHQNPGDKVVGILASYEQNIAEEYVATMKEIVNEITIVGAVVDTLQKALYELSQEEQDLLRTKYQEKKTWKEIANSLDITEGNAKRKRAQAIESMLAGKLKITLEQYQFCMDKIKDEREEI